MSFPCILADSMDVVVHASILVVAHSADGHPRHEGSSSLTQRWKLCGRQGETSRTFLTGPMLVTTHLDEGPPVHDRLQDLMFVRYETSEPPTHSAGGHL